MAKRSKPAFIADALARDDYSFVLMCARRGGEARARKKLAQKTEKIVDHEDDLYEQILEDPTITNTMVEVEQNQNSNEEYFFGGHL